MIRLSQSAVVYLPEENWKGDVNGCQADEDASGNWDELPNRHSPGEISRHEFPKDHAFETRASDETGVNYLLTKVITSLFELLLHQTDGHEE